MLLAASRPEPVNRDLQEPDDSALSLAPDGFGTKFHLMSGKADLPCGFSLTAGPRRELPACEQILKALAYQACEGGLSRPKYLANDKVYSYWPTAC